jgi:hypothetical protein
VNIASANDVINKDPCTTTGWIGRNILTFKK